MSRAPVPGRLFLVRHAHAVTAEEHALRPLSERGRADLRRLSAFLAASETFRPAQYWHSPLVRAAQTAQLLAAALDPEALLVETDGLRPEDSPDAMAGRLANYPMTHSIALVGHEPHLSALATLLVRGKDKPAAFVLRKASIVALQRTEDCHKRDGRPRWQVRWHLSPELLPGATTLG